jgi:hypothetical protein
MPQLAIETFVSQYFWLLVSLSGFYFFIIGRVIPNIALTLKSRKVGTAGESSEELPVNVSNRDKILEGALKGVSKIA